MKNKKMKKRWTRIISALVGSLILPLFIIGFVTVEIIYLQNGFKGNLAELRESWIAKNDDNKNPERNIAIALDPTVKRQYNLQPLYISYNIIFFAIFMTCLAIPGLVEKEIDSNSHVILVDDSNSFKKNIDIFFGKHSIFKNSFRGWLPIQAMFITNIVIFCAIGVFISLLALLKFTNLADPKIANILKFTLSLDKDLSVISGELIKWTIGIFTLFFGVYYKISTDYSSKWLYCANLYYKIFDLKGKAPKEYEAAKVALANDLLFMDLWNKRAFSTFFKTTLEEALSTTSDESAREAYALCELTEGQAAIILEDLLKIKLRDTQ